MEKAAILVRPPSPQRRALKWMVQQLRQLRGGGHCSPIARLPVFLPVLRPFCCCCCRGGASISLPSIQCHILFLGMELPSSSSQSASAVSSSFGIQNNHNIHNFGSANSSSSASPPAPTAMDTELGDDQLGRLTGSDQRGHLDESGGSKAGTSSSSILGKRNIAQLATEQIEPYVRKRRNSGSSSERSRKRAEKLNEEEQNILRLCINSRERRRMHDLNDALDELRRVIPYSEAAAAARQQPAGIVPTQSSARKLSKINTIILATNWIRQLNNELAQARAQNEKLLCKLAATKAAEGPEPENGKDDAKWCQHPASQVIGSMAERRKSAKGDDGTEAVGVANGSVLEATASAADFQPFSHSQPATASTAAASSSSNKFSVKQSLLPSPAAAIATTGTTTVVPHHQQQQQQQQQQIASLLQLGGQLQTQGQQFGLANVSPAFLAQRFPSFLLPPSFQLQQQQQQQALNSFIGFQNCHQKTGESQPSGGKRVMASASSSKQRRNHKKQNCHQNQQSAEINNYNNNYQGPAELLQPPPILPSTANFASVQQLLMLGGAQQQQNGAVQHSATLAAVTPELRLFGLALSALLPNGSLLPQMAFANSNSPEEDQKHGPGECGTETANGGVTEETADG